MPSNQEPIQNPIVVSNIALVLQAWIAKLQERMPGVSYVHDDQLSYETGLRRYRANQEASGDNTGFLPCMIFRRTVLRPAEEGMGNRAPVGRATRESPTDPSQCQVLKAVYGTFNLEFLYVHSTMQGMEEFEIAYLSDSLASEDKSLQIEIPDLGLFEYHLQHLPLESKLVLTEDNYYKAVQGSIIVRGTYFSVIGDSPALREINFNIKTFEGAVLGTCPIVAP